jgi:hypothetical protein
MLVILAYGPEEARDVRAQNTENEEKQSSGQ